MKTPMLYMAIQGTVHGHVLVKSFKDYLYVDFVASRYTAENLGIHANGKTRQGGAYLIPQPDGTFVLDRMSLYGDGDTPAARRKIGAALTLWATKLPLTFVHHGARMGLIEEEEKARLESAKADIAQQLAHTKWLEARAQLETFDELHPEIVALGIPDSNSLIKNPT